MPRKPNYGFDKRRKEQDRQARKDEKKAEKQRRREQEAASGQAPVEGGADVESSPLPDDRTS